MVSIFSVDTKDIIVNDWYILTRQAWWVFEMLADDKVR